MFRPLTLLAIAMFVSVAATGTNSLHADDMTGPEDPQAKVQPGDVDADAPADYTETASGLKYRVLRKGSGPTPSASDAVVAHYKGWLDNGTIFDSSYRRGEPTPFPLNQVIAGWTEGLQLIGEGGMIDLVIPPSLGYGSRGAGAAVPPNATLHFLVELKKVQ